jgi:hypothetical protein
MSSDKADDDALMSGEYPAKIAKDFVDKVCLFLDNKFGFTVIGNCYEGRNAASVAVDGRRVRFDLLVLQKQRETSPTHGTTIHKLYLFCECKWRTNPKYLKSELKKFLDKALATSQEIQNTYANNGFVFICNHPFAVSQKDIQDIQYLRSFLNQDHSLAELTSLSSRTQIIVLSDRFLELIHKGDD